MAPSGSWISTIKVSPAHERNQSSAETEGQYTPNRSLLRRNRLYIKRMAGMSSIGKWGWGRFLEQKVSSSANGFLSWPKSSSKAAHIPPPSHPVTQSLGPVAFHWLLVISLMLEMLARSIHARQKLPRLPTPLEILFAEDERSLLPIPLALRPPNLAAQCFQNRNRIGFVMAC